MFSTAVILALDFGYPAPPAHPSSIDDLTAAVIEEANNDFLSDRILVLAQDVIYADLATRCGALPSQPSFHLGKQFVANLDVHKISTGQSGSFGTKTATSDSAGTSWDALEKMKAKLDELRLYPGDIRSIVIVAHRLHFPRVLAQAKKLGLKNKYGSAPSEPRYTSLPEATYPVAAQWWCRSRFCWYLRELPGRAFLRLKGQL